MDQVTILLHRWACTLLQNDILTWLTLHAVNAELFLTVSELDSGDDTVSNHVKKSTAVCVTHATMKVHQQHLCCWFQHDCRCGYLGFGLARKWVESILCWNLEHELTVGGIDMCPIILKVDQELGCHHAVH
jgi:hypothetical protein